MYEWLTNISSLQLFHLNSCLLPAEESEHSRDECHLIKRRRPLSNEKDAIDVIKEDLHFLLEPISNIKISVLNDASHQIYDSR